MIATALELHQLNTMHILWANVHTYTYYVVNTVELHVAKEGTPLTVYCLIYHVCVLIMLLIYVL